MSEAIKTHAPKSDLYWKVRSVLNDLDQANAKDCAQDPAGMVITNHMRAAWMARDLILELIAEADAAKVGQ